MRGLLAMILSSASWMCGSAAAVWMLPARPVLKLGRWCASKAASLENPSDRAGDQP